MSDRSAAIVIRGTEVLLMKRIKNGEEYFTFPGGAVESNESPSQAASRELMEETSITADHTAKLGELMNRGRREHYFIMRYVAGEPVLGGEEKGWMNEDNQYYPGWYHFDIALALPNLYPREAVQKLKEYLKA